ncbi:MAG TPA: hypothetical protein VJ672_15625 [Gemmatimonadaceae bacterium]|nr:hypothetical protein [Gemmatimonadaceae bacterium]
MRTARRVALGGLLGVAAIVLASEVGFGTRDSGLGFGEMASDSTSPVQSPESRVPSILDLFDLRDGSQLRLPPTLREISDLAVTPDGRVLAIQDEAGVVSQLDVRRGTIVKSFALGPPAVLDDFEGLTVAGDRIYLLNSFGILYETREGASGGSVAYRRYDTGLRRQCEMEGLTYDATTRSLLIACKVPHAKTLRGTVTLYRWSLDTKALATPSRVAASISDATRGLKGKAYHPTAITRVPATANFVLLARQGIVTEITPAGAVLGTRALEQRLHPQPEGIAFLGDTLLLVSDEGGKGFGSLTLYSRAK